MTNEEAVAYLRMMRDEYAKKGWGYEAKTEALSLAIAALEDLSEKCPRCGKVNPVIACGCQL